MDEKDFIKITYTGKIKESGQVFDTMDNLLVIVGAGHVIEGLDEILKSMSVGEKKTVEIPPEKAFGERDGKAVKLLPISEFRRHNTKPYPGMTVNADNMRGRVLSVASGRVKVDFNHPLAGKVLEYEIEVKKKVENPEEKVKGLVNFYTKIEGGKLKTVFSENEIEIVVPPTIHPALKKRIADDIRKFFGVKIVKFSEVFEEPKKTE